MTALVVVTLFTRPTAAAPPVSDNDSLVGKPVIGKNADGVLEVFEVNGVGELRHRWQKAFNGDWSSWATLGTGFLPGLAVANDTGGHMEVFAVDRTNQSLHYIKQRATNSLEWSGWTNLGGAIRPPLTVGTDVDGRFEVFAVDATNSTVRHLWQTGTNNLWSSWSSVGGAVRPWLAIARNKDGRLELFGINETNHTLMHCWQETPNASSHWSEWADLGGCIREGFAVGENVVGSIEGFAVNRTNATINRIRQVNPSDSRQWTPWFDFGAQAKPGLTLGTTGQGRMEIFAVDAHSTALMHRWETVKKGVDSWSQWTNVAPVVETFPTVARNEDNDLEVFAVDPRNGKIMHQRQISSESGWLNWISLDHRTPQYNSRTWQVDEGLPGVSVQAITQTRDGYLWVGTTEGLARFDGLQFLTFSPKNIPELMNYSITALCASQDGALWVGTAGGLLRMKDGVFVRYSRADGLASNRILTICQIKDGSLWIGTDNGASRYHNGTFSGFGPTNELSSEAIHHIYQDSDGDVWIASSRSLNRLRTDGTMDRFTMPNLLPNDSVRAICEDKSGQIWIGSNNGMLWYNRIVGHGFWPYNTRYGLSDPFVSAICEDHEGSIWVGTYSGLNRFQQGKVYGQMDNEGLPFNKINALFEDRQGDLWVGTEEGLVRLKPNQFSVYTRQGGLTHNNISSVLQDRNGDLWVGTWGGGLDELKGGKISAFTSTNGLSGDLILSLCEGHDGSIWAGADYDGGLSRFKNGTATHYTWKDKLPGVGLRTLLEDSQGNLWMGSSEGLARMANGKVEKFGIQNHLPGIDVRAIYEDTASNLWVGTDGGLSCWKDGKVTNFTITNGLSDNMVLSLFQDSSGDMWIGTKTGGLNRFRKGKFTAYRTYNGLFNDEIFSILEDNEGWLWMTCSKGVFRVPRVDLDDFDQHKIDTIRCITYGKADGMESPECNGIGKPASWKDSEGKLWFPTTKGLAMADPATLLPEQAPPTVFIEQVIADLKPLIGDAQKLAMDTASDSAGGAPLQISPLNGELQFEYSALNLSSAERCRFKYKLDGVNPDWVDAGTRRTAYYNGVPPGHYNFHVIACNKDGIWNKSGATLAVVLEPHYWQTWWFEGLVVLAVISTASGTALYLTRRKMERKLEALKQRHAIEKERGRIAKDIHDDLGSTLTRITMLGERVEEGLANKEEVGVHVRKIVASARHTVRSMDEIVWAVNPDNDTLDGLVGYISHHADEFFEGAGVRCRLEMPVEVPRWALSAELRHNLFLVVKEAFNNVAKHSQASEVTVRVTAEEASIQIVIEDNGRGFDLNNAAARGNGLANLRRRMENIGGQLQITTQPGQGVRLQFTVQLEPQRHP